MNRRDAARDVWRAVVFAGAMLGCSSSSKPPAGEPTPPATETETAEPISSADAAAPAPPDAAPPDAAPPDAAPKRPRKSTGKPKGRGFLLV